MACPFHAAIVASQRDGHNIKEITQFNPDAAAPAEAAAAGESV